MRLLPPCHPERSERSGSLIIDVDSSLALRMTDLKGN